MLSFRCSNCANYLGDHRCKAFTDKIPEEIYLGFNTHDKVFPNQKNDIIFEEIK